VKIWDVIIIGAGPAGISAADTARQLGLDYMVLERGLIADTIYRYPIGLTVFSTPDELELAPGQLSQTDHKPTREQLLSYYVRFVLDNHLDIRTQEEVVDVEKRSDGFKVSTRAAEYFSRKLIFAIGAMDHPRRLSIPGEDLPKVHHLFRETYPWVGKKAVVVGGGNSAGEAALFLSREGVETTLAIFRQDWESSDPKQGCIKYWVKDPLEKERQAGCLEVFFLGSVLEILEDSILLTDESGSSRRLPNDVVFVLIGSDADLTLLESLGVNFKDSKYGKVPRYNSETFETDVVGLYTIGHFTEQRHIAGAIEAGRRAVEEIAIALGVNR